MSASPERIARIQSLFQGVDERTSIRIFQAFARFREVPVGQRDNAVELCSTFMLQVKKRADEDAVRFAKLHDQLEKARSEFRQFFLDLPDPSFELFFKGVEAFRQLSPIEKYEGAAELTRFLEQKLKPKP